MIEYEKLLAGKIREIEPSGIRRFFDIAAEMEEVISLGVGEPDFTTPWNIRQAGIRTLEQGKTWYSPNAGFKELKQEISGYLRRKFDLDYNPNGEIIVTVGGSEGIDMLIRAVINPGDEVIIPQPCYVSYLPIAHLSGARVVPIETKQEDEFRLTAAALKAAISPKTKLLIFPFPNNPTGGVMRRQHLEEIAEVLRGTDILVLSDEIYCELTYGEEKHVSIASVPGMKERTVVINGFSKSYAMTGWRLGYAAGPEPIMKEMLKIHQFAIMCAPSTSQFAAIEALKNGDESIAEMAAEYQMRRNLLTHAFNKMGLPCFNPQGAFYVFPSIKSTGLSSEIFCRKLLESEHVAVVPGNAFGESGEGYVRVSYSYSLSHLTEALRRIERFLDTLSGR